ncbi:unnamed protein product [Prorocentrum cordatum]|uniref:Uncharacterized protein n=1 Tax=Prorocentrum cordatum TaxID=2364126 RepID=A0ABN9Q2Z2_9DINO|nr:unnamed protein product [Polarella glacialis]
MLQDGEAALAEQGKGKVARPEPDGISLALTRCPTEALLAFSVGDGGQDANAHEESWSWGATALSENGGELALLEVTSLASPRPSPPQAPQVRGVLGAEGRRRRQVARTFALGAGREGASPVPRRRWERSGRQPRRAPLRARGARGAGGGARRGRRRDRQPREPGGRHLEGVAPRGARAPRAAGVALGGARGRSELARLISSKSRR